MDGGPEVHELIRLADGALMYRMIVAPELSGVWATPRDILREVPDYFETGRYEWRRVADT